MKNRKVYVTTFCGVAVAMNIVLGIITSALGIPLYLDTLELCFPQQFLVRYRESL